MSLWLWALDVALALTASAHILLHKRQPRSAALWLLWVWVLPGVGPLAYWFLGYNRVGLHPRRQPTVGKRAPGLRALGDSVTGLPLRPGNRIELLADGDRAFPAMLRALRGAKSQVDLQTYIFDLDEVGERFASELEAAARRGVRVRVLVDGVGAWGDSARLKRRLAAVGADCRSDWRLDRVFRQPLFNLRNHRKLLLVDGKLAFTGGLNISRRYSKSALQVLRQRLSFGQGGFRDLHFSVRGPVLADLAALFQEDWRDSGGKGGAQRVRAHRAGTQAARLVASGPDEDIEKLLDMLLGGLRFAKRRVDLVTPYFIPDRALLAQLRLLGRSGVRVRLFVPKTSDHRFMTWAARAYFADLLEAGIEIWQVGGPFVHSKAVVVDGSWCLIGSANLDSRSFRLNFELNLEAYSAALGKRLTRSIEGYRSQGRRVELAGVLRWTALQRLRSAAVNLMAPYL